MGRRPYRMGERQQVIEQTRTRILDAARELLISGKELTSFTVEAVARQADVARVTVYYQFGSKAGLLEALCNSLAANGGMDQMPGVFRQADPFAALDEFVRVFASFWDADRVITRRLRAMAVLDAEFGQVMQQRDERRRKGLRVITERLGAQAGQLSPEARETLIATLHTLTSFETFDNLAGTARPCTEMVPLVQKLCRAALHL